MYIVISSLVIFPCILTLSFAKHVRWLHRNFVAFHSIPFRSIPFHSVTFRYIPLHSVPFRSIPFHSVLILSFVCRMIFTLPCHYYIFSSFQYIVSSLLYCHCNFILISFAVSSIQFFLLKSEGSGSTPKLSGSARLLMGQLFQSFDQDTVGMLNTNWLILFLY